MKKTFKNYPSVATEVLRIYLILIVNDVCLLYVCNTQQLHLSCLIFVYEKEAVFVPKNRKVVVKFNEVTSSYKTDTPMAKSWYITERISELEKGID